MSNTRRQWLLLDTDVCCYQRAAGSNGATLKELNDAFTHVEALEQYDESGAILNMSAHEGAIACGRVDPELSTEDRPEHVRYLAGELRRAYPNGVESARHCASYSINIALLRRRNLCWHHLIRTSSAPARPGVPRVYLRPFYQPACRRMVRCLRAVEPAWLRFSLRYSLRSV